MTTKQFRLPDLGEGLTESELVAWHVAVGDTITLNQTIAEVESAKAVVALPSPFAGVVTRLVGEPGATISVGTVIAEFDVLADATAQANSVPAGAVSDGSASVGQASVGPASTGTAKGARSKSASAAPERNAVLVGYGAPVEGTDRPQRRARVTRASADERTPSDQAAAVGSAAPTGQVPLAQRSAERPRCSPPVRRLAHDLGVELETVEGSGENGTITREDVQAAASVSTQQQAVGESAQSVTLQLNETRTPISGVRRRTADAMVLSAFTAPHVTEFLTIDVTPTVELIAHLQSTREFRDHRLTMLSVVTKAVCIAIARNPSLNSRWDEANREIVQFARVNLGIAVATPRGLMVPNIPAADALTLLELADAVTALAETARAGAATPGQLTGGTFSISNVGVFGVDAGTPIINPGEAAILAIGAVRRLPWEHRGEVALREVMTLSLSFDHRLVDGEQGSRFLTDVGGILAEPGRALAMV